MSPHGEPPTVDPIMNESRKSPSTTRAALGTLAILLVAITGCTTIQPPANYVELRDPSHPYVFEAVSADDCRLAIREVPNEKNATLDFWATAVTNQLERHRGYEALGQREVKTDSGLKGRELLFGTKSRGVDYRYVVNVFPWRGWWSSGIYVVEGGGEATAFERDLPALRAAIKTLR